MAKINKTTSAIQVGAHLLPGTMETPDKAFRNAWVSDGVTIWLDTEKKAAILLDLAKEECGARISGYASTNTQLNLLAARGADIMSAEDVTAFGDAVVWIATMRATYGVLAAADDGFEKYHERVIKNDASWPELPANVLALVEKY